MSSTGQSTHLAKVARGGAIGLVGAVVSSLAGFALVVVVTNNYRPETAGAFFAATSVFLLIGSIACLGAETGLGRFMLRFESQGRAGDIPVAVRAALIPVVVLSVVVAAVIAVMADPLASALGMTSPHSATVLRLLAATLPFASVNTLALAGTMAFGRMRPNAVIENIFRAGAQPMVIAAVSAVSTGLIALTLAWAIPYVMAALISLTVFGRFLRRRGPFGAPTGRPVWREFWAFTWPRSITRVAQMAIQRIDIILVAALVGPAEAAIYTAATRFVVLGQAGTQAIQQVVQPTFTQLIATNNLDEIRSIYRVSTAWSMAVSWPTFLVAGAAPVAYLSLFGSAYTGDGVAVVVVMTIAMLFGVASGPADVLLLMSGRSRLSLANSLTALVLDVALCLVLIPELGMLGAAIARAVAVVVRTGLALVQSHRLLGVRALSSASVAVAAASVLTIAFPLLLFGLFTEIDLLLLLGATTLLVPAYLGALYLARGPLELRAFRGLLRVKRGSAPHVGASLEELSMTSGSTTKGGSEDA